MALFQNLREPSLSFVSDGETYELRQAWTNDLVFTILDSPLVARKLVTEESYQRWRKNHGTTDELVQFTKDSLAPAGIDGNAAYEFLAVINDDDLFPLLEADLLAGGVSLVGLLDGTVPVRSAIAVFAALPPTCAYKRKLNHPHADWTTGEYMLAELVDLMAFQVQLQHITAQVGGWKPTGKIGPEHVFRRPDYVETKPAMNPTTDLVNFLGAGVKIV